MDSDSHLLKVVGLPKILAMIQWPPEYQLRRSRRAKRLSMQVKYPQGLSIVIPYGVSLAEVNAFIEEKRAWILDQLQALKQRVSADGSAELPETLALLAVDRTLKIAYREAAGSVQLLARPHDELVLMGDVSEPEECQQLLKTWLKQEAKHVLSPWLRRLSQETGLEYQRLSVRAQKTLWGSCTSKGNISLNYLLLLIPPHLARHVMLHELCHLRYMNHSKRFWRLLKRFDADCEGNDRALNAVQKRLPLWLTHDVA